MDTILADLEGSTRYKEMAKEEKNLRQLQKQVGQLGGIRGPTTREQEKLEFQKKLVVELELRIAEKWWQVDRLGQSRAKTLVRGCGFHRVLGRARHSPRRPERIQCAYVF